ncbi:hypothetical protein JKP88DRAFT_336265 [Tribonema minus]|uniref:RING-type domain-containing protein n=1 Tax=Tribonema minus TaxID=303371 RepID=A0A836C8Y6_9STRA|nr:hypothetical protein JKP88DRAFT_336265 [Tribonema minus]
MNDGGANFTPSCVSCLQPISEDSGLLLSCQHFICGGCAATASRAQCPACADVPVDAVPLSSLPVEVGMYMQQPPQILQMVGEVWSFQASHYQATIANMRAALGEVTQAVGGLQGQVASLQRGVNSEMELRKRAEAENQALRQQLAQLQQQQQRQQHHFRPATAAQLYQQQHGGRQHHQQQGPQQRPQSAHPQDNFSRPGTAQQQQQQRPVSRSSPPKPRSPYTRPSSGSAGGGGSRGDAFSSGRPGSRGSEMGHPGAAPRTPLGVVRGSNALGSSSPLSLGSPTTRLRSTQLPYARTGSGGAGASDGSGGGGLARLRSPPSLQRPSTSAGGGGMPRPGSHGSGGGGGGGGSGGGLMSRPGTAASSANGSLGMGAMRGIGAPVSRRPGSSMPSTW